MTLLRAARKWALNGALPGPAAVEPETYSPKMGARRHDWKIVSRVHLSLPTRRFASSPYDKLLINAICQSIWL